VFRTLLDLLTEITGGKTWIPVDGGAYSIEILTPSINGIVLPSLCILFATLVSTTITQLRDRQLAVRECLNTEASDLYRLSILLAAMDDGERGCPVDVDGNVGVGPYAGGALGAGARVDLRKYVVRLIKESRPRNVVPDGGREEVSFEASELDAISATFYSSLSSPSRPLASSALELLAKLSDNRSRRVSFLQTTFPPLHYGILTLLAASISSCFLLETDQEALAFLNAVQLKLLFTMLVGTFSSLAVVCVDLSDPFGGSYSIGSTVLQLFKLRDRFNENECRGDE